MDSSWIIRDAHLMDPAAGTAARGDLFVTEGVISAAPPPGNPPVIDARGRALMPGLVDLHTHFREPGETDAETIASGSRAAARGGFTTVVTMPNTRPPIDTPEAVRDALERAAACGLIDVLPSACITRQRRGRALAPLGELAAAGAVAFTDDGATVADDALMEAAMRAAAALGRPVMDHALDPRQSAGGVLHAGDAARRLGLPGIPSAAEDTIVERDIRLAELTGCHTHIQHLSSGRAAGLVRAAHDRGQPVSAEITPHHLALSDADIPGDNAAFKMNPPLRSPADRDALVQAVCDRVVTILATDHAPHTAALKAKGFRGAPFGVVGLETALGVTYRVLVVDQGLDPLDWLRCWTTAPAAVIGLPPPGLQPGARADLLLADLDAAWVVEPAAFASASHNTPFAGYACRGRPVCTLKRGHVAWQDS